MLNQAMLPTSAGDVSSPTRDYRRLAVLVGAFQLAMLGLFLKFAAYPDSFAVTDSVQYVFYLNVTVMMLVGFGFLMTFQKLNGLSAVGLTFLVTTISIPWAILTGRFFASVAGNVGEYPGAMTNATIWSGSVEVNVGALLQGNFAAAAVLISFGAVIGKISPSQLALMTMLEVPLYSLNKEVFCIGAQGTLDMGGTIFIHLFGAFFGLAVAYVIGKPKDDADAEASRVSDVFSLLGTVFLWIYWPSFNGATAGVGGEEQLLTTVNTVMALCASCLTTFVVTSLLNKRLSTVDIQNATLAGGVAIGAASNLKITPGIAMLVGVIAATISTFGFSRLQSALERKLGLHDSCGVHNLHGMPAILGSIVVSIAVSVPSAQGDVVYPKGDNQAWAQLGGAGATLVFSLASGLVVGKILRVALPNRSLPFLDSEFWTTADKSV
jgi:ammonium transporter Rh